MRQYFYSEGPLLLALMVSSNTCHIYNLIFNYQCFDQYTSYLGYHKFQLCSQDLSWYLAKNNG